MPADTPLDQVRSHLLHSERCIVVSHFNPDPDAYGASCGLTLALRSLGKEAVCLNQNGAPERYGFIPGVAEIRREAPPGEWDTLFVCDCADMNRLGDDLLLRIPAVPTVVNIDHHISNDLFGTVRLVDSGASSSSELVYRILEGIPGALSRAVAECLLYGMYGDTGAFRYSCTNVETFRVATKLCELGAVPFEVATNLFGSMELRALRLQASALLNVRMRFDNRVAGIVVTREMLEETGAAVDDAEMLAERARDIAGVDVAYSIRQDGDIWRVSLRSKGSTWNMSEIAARFGGGGHVSAAAFRSRRPCREIEENLLAAIGEVLNLNIA